jgi:cysteinyl-tRNA synthetase
VVRFFILRAHYRSPLNYSDAHLVDASAAWTACTSLRDVPPASAIDWTRVRGSFRRPLNDDFDSHGAIAVLFELAAEAIARKVPSYPACSRRWGGDRPARTEPMAYLQGGAGAGGLDERHRR